MPASRPPDAPATAAPTGGAVPRHARLWFTVLLVLLTLPLALLVVALCRALDLPGGATTQALALCAAVPAAVLWPMQREHARLREGGAARVMRFAGGRLIDEPGAAREKLVLMVAEELSARLGLPVPAVYVLDDEPGINGLAADDGRDAVIALTQGAVQQLRLDELQGVVARLLAQLASGAARRHLRLLPLTWGLTALHRSGRARLGKPTGAAGPARHGWAARACGHTLLALGRPGWLGAQWLQHRVCRQEVCALDTQATRLMGRRSGLGQALRKVMFATRYAPLAAQRRLAHPEADWLAPLLLHSRPRAAGWSAHPSPAQRLKQLYGRERSPLVVPAWDRRGRVPTRSDRPASPAAPAPAAPLQAPVAAGSAAAAHGARTASTASAASTANMSSTAASARPGAAPTADELQGMLMALRETVVALQTLAVQQAKATQALLTAPANAVATAPPAAANPANAAPGPAATPPALPPQPRPAPRGPRLDEAQRQVLARLLQLEHAGAWGCALLALMLSEPGGASRPGGPGWASWVIREDELQVWTAHCQSEPHGRSILVDVHELPAAARPALIGELLARLATEPASVRLHWLDAARQLMRLPARSAAVDRLWWLLLSERLGRRPSVAQAVLAADAGADGLPPPSGTDPDAPLPARAALHAATFTALLAHVVPWSTPTGEVGAQGEAWYYAVMARLARGPVPRGHLPPEVLAFSDSLWDAASPVLIDASTQALWALLDLPEVQRERLCRVWVEEARAAAAATGLSHAATETLRLAALLLETHPPQLDALA